MSKLQRMDVYQKSSMLLGIIIGLLTIYLLLARRYNWYFKDYFLKFIELITIEGLIVLLAVCLVITGSLNWGG